MYLDYIERNRISKEQKYHTGLKTKSSTMFIYIKSILNTANYRGGGGAAVWRVGTKGGQYIVVRILKF